MTGAAGYMKYRGVYICPYMDGYCIKANRSDINPLHKGPFKTTIEAKAYINKKQARNRRKQDAKANS